VSGQSGAWQKSPVGVRESGSLLAHPTGFLFTGEGRAVASMAVSSPTCSLVIGGPMGSAHARVLRRDGRGGGGQRRGAFHAPARALTSSSNVREGCRPSPHVSKEGTSEGAR
jgi:hypothetical protein